MSIEDFCKSRPSTALPDETLREAARRMTDDGVGCLVVVDDDLRPLGMITDRDIVMRGMRRRRDLDKTTVSQVMTGDVTTVPAFTLREVAIRRLRAEGIRRIPVVDDAHRLCGVFSVDDALQAFAECATGAAAVARSQFPETQSASGAISGGKGD